MAETDWCEHCDLPLATCVHGQPAAGRTLREPVLATGHTMDSVFSGRCAACGEAYPEGTSITHSTEADGWCHTSCTTTEGLLP